MASGCFGGRRNKMSARLAKNNEINCQSGSTTSCSNSVERFSVVSHEMCFFCFDVLSSHLNCMDPPKMPSFTNNS